MHAQKGLVVGQHEATRRRLRRQQPGLDLVDAGNDFLRMRDPRGRRQRLPRGDVATDADQHKDQPAEHQGSGGVAFCFSGQHRVPQTTIVWSSPMQAPCLCFTSLVRWRHGVACARRRRYPCGESSSRARVGHFSWALPVVVQRAAAPCPRVARGLAHPAGGCIQGRRPGTRRALAPLCRPPQRHGRRPCRRYGDPGSHARRRPAAARIRLSTGIAARRRH